MMMRRHSPDYHFFGDTATGVTMRWGATVGTNPLRAPWPELADISISNHCSKGCGYCYRDSKADASFLSVDHYDLVLRSLQSERWGSVFQVALGGGEPLEHPEFDTIIALTNRRGIIANFTTNGDGLTEKLAASLVDRVGAVAVSVHQPDAVPEMPVRLLIEAGIKTNLHYVLDNRSLDAAVELLKGAWRERLHGVNGVVFLTYKPKGRAARERCLRWDSRLAEFLALVQNNQSGARIGFDACFVPLLLKYTQVDADYIDACECGFFSVYIDERLNVKPCSFTTGEQYTYNLKEYGMEEIWNQKYALYRQAVLNNHCTAVCDQKEHCRGKCLFFDGLTLCYREQPETPTGSG